MKKIFILPFLIPTVAFAIKIDANTQLKWNPNVVVLAANEAGLYEGSGIHKDVESTYYNLMMDLLQRETFSVSDAVTACVKQCNKSDFLKNGRGQSGKKCPGICEEFGKSLIKINNDNSAKKYDGEELFHIPQNKIYTEDKRFYVAHTDKKIKSKKDSFGYEGFATGDVIYETATNNMIAIGYFYGGDGYDPSYDIIDQKYKDFVFNGYADEHGREGWLSYTDYKKESSKLKPQIKQCIKMYEGLDLNYIKSISKDSVFQVVVPYERNSLLRILNNAQAAQKFNLDSIEKYDAQEQESRLSSWYHSNCYDGDLLTRDKINSRIKVVTDKIQCIKRSFKSSSEYAKVQEETLEDATYTIRHGVEKKCGQLSSDLPKCSGDCNGPGKQDYVTCTFGGLQATFEFDDICEGNWKQKAKSFFGK